MSVPAGFLDDLRNEFRVASRARIGTMAALVDRISRDQSDRDSLEELLRHFHGFAGMGGTCGFPRISLVAERGEAAIRSLVGKDADPSPMDVERWRSLISDLQHELSDDVVPAGGATAVPQLSDRRLQAMTALIVDAHKHESAQMAGLLEAEEVSTRVVSSKRAALAGNGGTPDVLITDARLTDGSGYELIEAMRKAAAGKFLRAVILGEAGEFMAKVTALRRGADAVLEKPVDAGALLRKVNEFRQQKYRTPDRVLVVDSDAAEGQSIRETLLREDCEVSVCGEPSQFESILCDIDPELVIIEMQIAGVPGALDLLRYLRQSERYATLPVILITSPEQVGTATDLLRSGGDAYVVRPIDPTWLCSSVVARLQRARAVRALLEHDVLTSVLTRPAFEQKIAARLARHRRAHEAPPVLCMVDLDEFKSVNDRHGHAAGDRVLIGLAALLRRKLRQSDTVGRYGGDEFMLLLEDVDLNGAKALIERLLADFRAIEHHGRNSATFSVSCSAGIAPLRSSYEEAMHAVDVALYDAKRTGRARVVVAA